ncbi:MAG: alanine--tRNA ligase [Chthonomonadales bacterium]|nr:alanine--tRNA ligase [Chthonomonadales bacterium]
MSGHELRQKYIEFFIGKGHLHLPGAPVVPIDVLGVEDPSTLFTSAGMQQFKPYFVAEAVPPGRRIVTVQKCVRTGDIDRVGDHSHLTFFEMLGNFSFGDYFKAEVIPWTWEFLTGWLGLDGERMCVTVFEEDDEAFDVWRRTVGLPADRIHRLGGDKNFWPPNAIEDGPNGPCGPCTEIFYRIVEPGEMTSDPALTPAERFQVDDDAGRWLEIWNNVFTQYDRYVDEHGKPVLRPLPNRNNDTGAGFERIVCVLQGVPSVFESDLFASVVARIEELSGRAYGGTMGPVDFAIRVVAEHARTAAFCIADGILPSNEGRGYVLRRIMRRAIRFGKTVLGFEEPFIDAVIPAVIERMAPAYPELVERREHILRTVRAEEERFRRTLDHGMHRLLELVEAVERSGGSRVEGEDAFTLYDTYGFPLELTEEIAAEHGLNVERAGFGRAMEEQRRRSQEASEIHRDLFRSMGAALAELQRTTPATEFTGYQLAADRARVVALVRGGELVDFARAGDEVEIVLNRTPFYAESGGQVGDTGTMETPRGDTTCAARAQVLDSRRAAGIVLHRARVLEGELATDAEVTAAVDAERRMHVKRNHTATHLLHAALREALGTHVHQKGSLVAPDRLRFDFTHTRPMTDAEVRSVEDAVNAAVLRDAAVEVEAEVPIAEAKARGAMALFGEKYGERVRVVEVPGTSVELCGGTHLARTGQVGLFKIVSETGVAAGVRRVEALTGQGAYAWVQQREEVLGAVARALKSSPRDVATAAEKLAAQRAQLEKQVQQLKARAATADEAEEQRFGQVRFVSRRFDTADGEILAGFVDDAAPRNGTATVALAGGAHDGKVALAVRVTPDLVERGFNAGTLVREAARVAGGGGGGRPDFAQAGGRDPSRLGDAIARAADLVRERAGDTS